MSDPARERLDRGDFVPCSIEYCGTCQQPPESAAYFRVDGEGTPFGRLFQADYLNVLVSAPTRPPLPTIVVPWPWEFERSVWMSGAATAYLSGDCLCHVSGGMPRPVG